MSQWIISLPKKLKHSLKNAATKTRLSQAEIMREGLRMGVRRLATKKRPLIKYLEAFCGLVGPSTETVAESRFR